MRSIDLRVPALAGLAVLLLAFVPEAKAAEAPEIEFVSGTGEKPVAASTVIAGQPADRRNTEVGLDAIAADLADPRVQGGVAAMAERIGETMLDLPVGKFAAAIEKARPGTIGKRIREDATVEDLAGRDAERLPEQFGKGSRQMLTILSGFAAAFATMMPEFERLGRDFDYNMRDIKRARD